MRITSHPIKTLHQLDAALARGHHDFAIMLTNQCFSRKEITKLSPTRYRIYNSIDESIITLPASKMFDQRRTNIGHAMKCGAFVSIRYTN